MSTKACNTCKVEKETSEFKPDIRYVGGFKHKCNACLVEYRKQYRLKNLEKIRAHDIARGNRNTNISRAEYRERKRSVVNAGQRRRYKANAEKRKTEAAEYRKAYPKKVKAHNIACYAVKTGKLIKPNNCEDCGSERNLTKHHDDYDKPLEVRWLCKRCHRNWHNKYGEGLNAI